MASTISRQTLTGGGNGLGSRPRMYPKSTTSKDQPRFLASSEVTYRERSDLEGVSRRVKYLVGLPNHHGTHHPETTSNYQGDGPQHQECT